MTTKKAKQIVKKGIFQKKANGEEYKGKIYDSLRELVSRGITRTGSSGYSKGWASKDIWTGEVKWRAIEAGLKVESGNDAPRGGASGEYVRLIKGKNPKVTLYCNSAKLLNLKIDSKMATKKAILAIVRKEELEGLLPFVWPGFGDFCPTAEEIVSARIGMLKNEKQQKDMSELIKISGIKVTDFWRAFRDIRHYNSFPKFIRP